MPNKHRGETAVKIGRKTYTLVYDWQALAALRDEIGPNFDEQIGAAVTDLNVDVLAKALSIGLRKHHRDVLSVAEIVAESPPVVTVSGAINEALTLAFHGPGQPEEARNANPPKGLLTWLPRLWATRVRQA